MPPALPVLFSRICIALALAWLSGCDSGTAKHAVGGTVSGLAGSGLVLANGGDSLEVPANGAFSFRKELPKGAAYAITVQSHPAGQSCVVANGTGIIGAVAVTDAAVTCSTAAALALVSSYPIDGATGMARTIAPTLNFSAALAPSTAIPANITLLGTAGPDPIRAAAAGDVLTVTPQPKLLPLASYTLTASTAVRGANGEQLPAAVGMTFTTADGAWQDGGLLAPESTGETFDPRVAMSANGDAIALWRQTDGTHWWTRSRRYIAGSGWGDVIDMEAGTTLPAPLRGLVADARGNAFAVWEVTGHASCPEEVECARYTLLASRFEPGSGWSDARTIATAVGRSGMAPDIAMNASGDAMIVWTQYDGARPDAWSRRYTAAEGWRGAVRLEDTSQQASPEAVAMDDSGNAFVAWTQRAGANLQLWARRYVAGEGWAAAQQIGTGEAVGLEYVQLAMDNAAHAVLAWTQVGAPQGELRSSAWSAGSGWGAPQLIADSDQVGGESDMGMDAAGNVVLAWRQVYRASPTEFRVNIWASRRMAGAWSAPTLLDNAANTWPPVQVEVDRRGNAIAAWARVDGGRYDIMASRLVADAGWSAAGLLESDDTGDAMLTSLAMDASGDALAAWHQYDGVVIPGAKLHARFRRFE
jgi:hypothetical protein